MRRLFHAALGVAFLIASAIAQTGLEWITFQGRLTTPVGFPLADGSYSVVFRIFDQPTGGTLRWSETLNVQTSKGLFNAALGKGTAFPNQLFSAPMWIEIEIVGQGTLVPRQPIGSVPYALTALGLPANTVTTAMLQNGGVTNAKIANGSVDNAKLAPNSVITAAIADGAVTAGKLANDSGSLTRVSGGSLAVWSGGNIGVNSDRYLGLVPSDSFAWDGRQMGNYSLGWYGDSGWGGYGAVMRISGYGGIRFFTTAGERMKLGPDGNLTVYNQIWCGQLIQTSTRELKKDIAPLSGGLDKVMDLRPVSYNWKKDGKPDIGFIAEDVAKVLPVLVGYDEKGKIGGMDYGKLTSVLVKAIQEQQAKINDLESRIKSLEDRCSKLK